MTQIFWVQAPAFKPDFKVITNMKTAKSKSSTTKKPAKRKASNSTDDYPDWKKDGSASLAVTVREALVWTDEFSQSRKTGESYLIWSESYAGRHGGRGHHLMAGQPGKWRNVPDSNRRDKSAVKKFAQRYEDSLPTDENT